MAGLFLDYFLFSSYYRASNYPYLDIRFWRMNMDENYVNCHYCGTKMSLYAPNCPNCGAPNTPDPLPWYTTLGLRFKASLRSKQESVWADRLASLMPIQFIISLL